MSFVPTSTTVIDPWTRILGALEKKVNRHSFNTWLKPTRISHQTERILFVRISNMWATAMAI
jgi:chromosomal replication initiator protein